MEDYKPKFRWGMNLSDCVSLVSKLKEGELREEIKNFKGGFELDFTDDYLDAASEDRLKHILLAAYTTKIAERKGLK